MKKNVVTHFNVDLDAVCSVWAYRTYYNEEATVRFVPANIKAEDIREDEVPLDLSCGLKGHKFEDGRIGSCFRELMYMSGPDEEYSALAPLIQFVDAQDATGKGAETLIKRDLVEEGIHEEEPIAKRIFSSSAATLQSTGLTAVLRAFQAVNREDAWVCEQMGVILDGIRSNALSRLRAEKEADAQEMIGHVAIVRNAKEFATNGILYERGARFVIFIDGNNMGVTRRNGVVTPTSIILPAVPEEERDEWFVHPAGFLTARGTRKAPAGTPSKADPYAIAAILDSADPGLFPGSGT